MMQKMNKALIIIDVQNDYFENGPAELVGANEASEKAKLVLERFRNENGLIIHIQHVANRPSATYFLPETMGVEIHENVTPKPGEKIVVKHFPNSFRATGLLEYLRANSITDLVICGMMTHMCVDSTTRAANDYGFTCVVIGDACATKELAINGSKVCAADVQTGFLSALNYFYATVKTAEQYLNNQ
jgi:nicotinamidase-related amidase